MITFIKRWLEKREFEKFQNEIHRLRGGRPPLFIIHKDENGNLMAMTHDEVIEYNSPLQQAIRSRGGYL